MLGTPLSLLCPTYGFGVSIAKLFMQYRRSRMRRCQASVIALCSGLETVPRRCPKLAETFRALFSTRLSAEPNPGCARHFGVKPCSTRERLAAGRTSVQCAAASHNRLGLVLLPGRVVRRCFWQRRVFAFFALSTLSGTFGFGRFLLHQFLPLRLLEGSHFPFGYLESFVPIGTL